MTLSDILNRQRMAQSQPAGMPTGMPQANPMQQRNLASILGQLRQRAY